jgi:hypothetical protein
MSHEDRIALLHAPLSIITYTGGRTHGGTMLVDDKVSNAAKGHHRSRQWAIDSGVGEQ